MLYAIMESDVHAISLINMLIMYADDTNLRHTNPSLLPVPQRALPHSIAPAIVTVELEK